MKKFFFQVFFKAYTRLLPIMGTFSFSILFVRSFVHPLQQMEADLRYFTFPIPFAVPPLALVYVKALMKLEVKENRFCEC